MGCLCALNPRLPQSWWRMRFFGLVFALAPLFVEKQVFSAISTFFPVFGGKKGFSAFFNPRQASWPKSGPSLKLPEKIPARGGQIPARLGHFPARLAKFPHVSFESPRKKKEKKGKMACTKKKPRGGQKTKKNEKTPKLGFFQGNWVFSAHWPSAWQVLQR